MSRSVARLEPLKSRACSKLECLASMQSTILTMVRDQESANQQQQDGICSRRTAKTPKLILEDNDEYDSSHSQERPSKRRKTEQHNMKDTVLGQRSPRQTIQSNGCTSIVTIGTRTPLIATDSERPPYIDSETLNSPNQDAQSEDSRTPASGGTQLAQSQKSSIKTPVLAETSAEGEQQELNPNTQDPAEKAACTQVTAISGVEVCQTFTQAPSPQASRNINQENSGKHTYHLRHSPHSPTSPSAEIEDVKVKGSPTQSTKVGKGSSDKGSVLPELDTVSMDSVISFPLCTSCGIKRVFNTPRNGETKILW